MNRDDEGNPTQIITHVAVTPSCQSDAAVTVPVIESLSQRQVQPRELFADTTYGSGSNAVEAERRGTELVSPVAGSFGKLRTGSEPRDVGEKEENQLSAADFQIDVSAERLTVCPANHTSIDEWEDEAAPELVEIHFAQDACATCPRLSVCPVKLDRRQGAYVLDADLVKVNIERRRRQQASGEFARRYAVRAGVEGTNSELKRAHGLGRLRVRGGPRVALAAYLKALACNMKRMVLALLAQRLAMAKAEETPVVAAA